MQSASLQTLLRIAVTAACLVLAFVGFLQAYPPAHPPRPLIEYLEIAYRSIQLTFGQFPQELRGQRVPLPLQIARFALPVAAAWVTLSVGWTQFRNRVRIFLIRRRGDHLVVFGESALAEGLVRGERTRKGDFILWVDQTDSRLAREVEGLRGAHADGSVSGLALKRLGLEKARAVVAAGDSDTANMEVARRVMDYAGEKRRAGDPLQIIARVDEVALGEALEARLSRREQHERLNLRLASAPQLLARQFLLANPIDRVVVEPGAPIRLCWIGWSPLAEMMVVRVLASAHFGHQVRLELVVADLDAGRAEAAFRSRRPGANEIASIRFESLPDDASSIVAEWLTRQSAEAAFNAIYVTLTAPSRALSASLAVETALAKTGRVGPAIYAHLPDTGVHARTLVDDSLVQPFGAVTSLADPEILLQEKHDDIARSIHEFYLEGRLAEGEALGDRATLAEWSDLPEAIRDENRLVADCYVFKLREIDAAVVDGPGEQMRFTPEEVEVLAEAEHRRWMAAKLLSGWSVGERRDDDLKTHPDLVAYSALNERVKDLDREQIRMIPRILSSIGRRAMRNLTVQLTPGGAASVVPADVRSRLTEVAAAYPDRRLVILGDPEDPGSRDVLVATAAAGGAWSLVSRGPAQLVLQSAPGSERERLMGLFRGADRIHAHSTPPEPELNIELATLSPLSRQSRPAARSLA